MYIRVTYTMPKTASQKTKILIVRTTPMLKQACESAAGGAGLSVSEWTRAVLARAAHEGAFGPRTPRHPHQDDEGQPAAASGFREARVDARKWSHGEGTYRGRNTRLKAGEGRLGLHFVQYHWNGKPESLERVLAVDDDRISRLEVQLRRLNPAK